MPSIVQRIRSASASFRAPSTVSERDGTTASTAEGDTYLVQVIAFGDVFVVPVSMTTPVPVVLRHVMEAAVTEEQAVALGCVEGTLYYKEKPMTLDAVMGSVPRNAVLHLHTSLATVSAVVHDLRHGSVTTLPAMRQRSSANTITMQPCRRSQQCGPDAMDSPTARRVSAESGGLTNVGTPDRERQEGGLPMHHASFMESGFSYPDLGGRSMATFSGSVPGAPAGSTMLWPPSMFLPGTVPEAPYYYFVPRYSGPASAPAGAPLRLHGHSTRTTAVSSLSASRRRESAVEFANSFRRQSSSFAPPLSAAVLTAAEEAPNSPPPSPPLVDPAAVPHRFTGSNDRYIVVYLRLPREKAAAQMSAAALNADCSIVVESVTADDVPAEGLLDATMSTVASTVNSRVGAAAYTYRRLRVERDFPVGTLRELCAVPSRFRLFLAHAEVPDETKSFRALRAAPNSVFYFRKASACSSDASEATQLHVLTRARLRQHLDATSSAAPESLDVTRESAADTMARLRTNSQVEGATATATATPVPLLSTTQASEQDLEERPSGERACSPTSSTLSIQERISAFNDGAVQNPACDGDAAVADADDASVATSADRYVVEGHELTLTSAVVAEEARRQAERVARVEAAVREAAAADTEGVDIDCCLPEERAREQSSPATEGEGEAGPAAALPAVEKGRAPASPSAASAGSTSPSRPRRLSTSSHDASEAARRRRRASHHSRRRSQEAAQEAAAAVSDMAAEWEAGVQAASGPHAGEAPLPATAAIAAASKPRRLSATRADKTTTTPTRAATSPTEKSKPADRRASLVAKLRGLRGARKGSTPVSPPLTPAAPALKTEQVSEGTPRGAPVNPLAAYSEEAPVPAAAAQTAKAAKKPQHAARGGNASGASSCNNSTEPTRRGSTSLLASLRRLASPKSRTGAVAAERAAVPTAKSPRRTSSPPSNTTTAAATASTATAAAGNRAAALSPSEEMFRVLQRASERRRSSGSSGTSPESTATGVRSTAPPAGRASAIASPPRSPSQQPPQSAASALIPEPAAAARAAAPAAPVPTHAQEENEEAPAPDSPHGGARFAGSPSYSQRQRRSGNGVPRVPVDFLGSKPRPLAPPATAGVAGKAADVEPAGPEEVSTTVGPAALSSTRAPTTSIPTPRNLPTPVSILVSPALEQQQQRQTRLSNSARRNSACAAGQSGLPGVPTPPRSPRRAADSLSPDYSVESTSSTNRLRITIRDPRDPTRFHYGVPVEPDCPVGELRKWVTSMQQRASSDGHERPDLSNSTRYGIFLADVHLPDADRVTFAEVTSGRNDAIFSIRRI